MSPGIAPSISHGSQVALRGGVCISQLGLGTATLGGMYTSVSESDVSDAIHTALDLGVTFIDTAPHYGKGADSDQAISEAFPALERMRDQGIIKSIGVGMNQSAIPIRFIKETDIDLAPIAGAMYNYAPASAEILARARKMNSVLKDFGALSPNFKPRTRGISHVNTPTSASVS